jgi:hypothetical protein
MFSSYQSKDQRLDSLDWLACAHFIEMEGSGVDFQPMALTPAFGFLCKQTSLAFKLTYSKLIYNRKK